jgi:Mrp family chromosome partitioning ATPase
MNTDQAFIKAYRHDSAESAPMGRAGRRPTAEANATTQTLQNAYADPFGSTVAYVSSGNVYSNQTAGSLTAGPLAAARKRTITPRPVVRSSPKRPLSSFTNTPSEIESPLQSRRPATTISSLRWPAACRQLLRQHGRHFDRVLDLLLAQADEGRSLIGIIGLFRGVGCTTTALCLGGRAASRGRRVVMVDGHFQSPRLSECADAEPIARWQEVLERGAPLADAVIRAQDENLDLLVIDPSAPTSLPSLRLAANGGELRHDYDLALVDLGTFFDPISQPTALELARHLRIDAAIGVTSPLQHDPRDVETAAHHLGQCGCDLLGIIDNRIS